MIKTIVKILVLFAAIYTSYSLCNSCSAITGLACVDNDKFSVCVNGLPTTSVTQCPVGTVCTATSQICSSNGTTPGSCSRCGLCSSDKIFACTGYNTFALCYGATTPSSANFTCTGSLVCNIDDPQICINPATTGIGGTCPSISSSVTIPGMTITTPVTRLSTTVRPTTNPQNYCANVTSSGRFEVTTDPYCKQYILCTLLNSTWIGNIYECPGSTLFNSTTRLCGVGVPQRCT